MNTRYFVAGLVAVSFVAAASRVYAADERVTYFLGEVRMSTPAGRLVATTLSLVRRALTPDENRMVEVVASIDSTKPTKEFTTVFEVQGSRFVMKDAEGAFTGAGELKGAPWEWTGWSYEVEFTGATPGKLKGDDVLNGDGLTARKSFMTPDGVVRAQFVEELKPISKAAYDILHSRLLPK
ncbi:MAG: hypothetical protein ABI854_01895 [Betaproteobacteria bacterium]